MLFCLEARLTFTILSPSTRILPSVTKLGAYYFLGNFHLNLFLDSGFRCSINLKLLVNLEFGAVNINNNATETRECSQHQAYLRLG
jgi:hypothetical protein